MNIFETYEHLIRVELERMVSAGHLPSADFTRVAVEPPRDPMHGDLSTNAALIAAGKADKAALAQVLARHFVSLHDVTAATPTDAGFINLTLKSVVWQRAISGILHGKQGTNACEGIIYDAAKDFSIADRTFSVQHARTICCAVIRQGAAALGDADVSDNSLAASALDRLSAGPEIKLMHKLAAWPHATRSGGRHPRQVYAQELAAALREACAAQQGNAALGFVNRENVKASVARLALVRATALVLAECAS